MSIHIPNFHHEIAAQCRHKKMEFPKGLLLKILFFLTALIPFYFLGTMTVSAQAPLSPNDVAQRVFDRERGENAHSTAQMVLVNNKGKKRSRKFTALRLKRGALESNLIRFLEPADINGTGFLTIEKDGWETDQFLYLPALRRTRRIVSSQKSHSFVNSDFSYEDMERHPVDDYHYTLEPETEINGVPCYVLLSRPKDGVESQYDKVITHIVKETFIPLLTHFYDSKGKMVKQYKVMKLEKVQNIWTEKVILMENLKKDHKTYISIDQIEYNGDIDATALTQQALENY